MNIPRAVTVELNAPLCVHDMCKPHLDLLLVSAALQCSLPPSPSFAFPLPDPERHPRLTLLILFTQN